MSTVRATRAADEAALLAAALPRVDALLAEGVTTIEIKSGYGLDLDTEPQMLRVARGSAASAAGRVRTTFLGAHALPPEFAAADAYIDEVCSDAARRPRRGTGRRGRRLLRGHRLFAGPGRPRVRGRARARPAGEAARRAAVRPRRRELAARSAACRPTTSNT